MVGPSRPRDEDLGTSRHVPLEEVSSDTKTTGAREDLREREGNTAVRSAAKRHSREIQEDTQRVSERAREILLLPLSVDRKKKHMCMHVW